MNGTGNIEGISAKAVPQRHFRYRFTDASGRIYAPFRPRPGFTIRDIIASAFPGDAHDSDWGLEKVGT